MVTFDFKSAGIREPDWALAALAGLVTSEMVVDALWLSLVTSVLSTVLALVLTRIRPLGLKDLLVAAIPRKRLVASVAGERVVAGRSRPGDPHPHAQEVVGQIGEVAGERVGPLEGQYVVEQR